jgi:hypothetical protein
MKDGYLFILLLVERKDSPPATNGSESSGPSQPSLVGPSTIPFRDTAFQNAQPSAPPEPEESVSPSSPTNHVHDSLGQLGAVAHKPISKGPLQSAEPSGLLGNQAQHGGLGQPGALVAGPPTDTLASRSSIGQHQFIREPNLSGASGPAHLSVGTESLSSLNTAGDQQQPSLYFGSNGHTTGVPETSHQTQYTNGPVEPVMAIPADLSIENWTAQQWNDFERELGEITMEASKHDSSIMPSEKSTAENTNEWLLVDGLGFKIAPDQVDTTQAPFHPPLATTATDTLGPNGLPIRDIFNLPPVGSIEPPHEPLHHLPTLGVAEPLHDRPPVGIVEPLRENAPGTSHSDTGMSESTGLPDHTSLTPSVAPVDVVPSTVLPTGNVNEMNSIGPATNATIPSSALRSEDHPAAVRVRRPAGGKVMPVATQWLDPSFKYLIEGMEIAEWKRCVQVWYEFERQEISEHEISSVSE